MAFGHALPSVDVYREGEGYGSPEVAYGCCVLVTDAQAECW
jgi:hypothetical protein